MEVSRTKFDRFFAFGCSFTDFHWPTWASIIAKDLDIPSYNYGICGLGNVGIMHRMLEADLKHKFTKRDLIVVVWSSWPREDRYRRDHWVATGNILNSDCSEYDRKWLKDYWSIENDIVKNCTAIILSNKAYDISFQSTIHETDDSLSIYNTHPIYHTFKSSLPKMPLFPWLPGPDYRAYEDNLYADNHPDVLAHLNFVKDYVYPSLGLNINPETDEYFTNAYNVILKYAKAGILNKRIKNWDDLKIIFKEMFNTERIVSSEIDIRDQLNFNFNA